MQSLWATVLHLRYHALCVNEVIVIAVSDSCVLDGGDGSRKEKPNIGSNDPQDPLRKTDPLGCSAERLIMHAFRPVKGFTAIRRVLKGTKLGEHDRR